MCLVVIVGRSARPKMVSPTRRRLRAGCIRRPQRPTVEDATYIQLEHFAKYDYDAFGSWNALCGARMRGTSHTAVFALVVGLC